MAQGDQQQFCLRWNDFQTNMVSSFKHLRDEKSFTDVTLACDGQTCKAHKMVLSACSPYFKVRFILFQEVLCKQRLRNLLKSCRVKLAFLVFLVVFAKELRCKSEP